MTVWVLEEFHHGTGDLVRRDRLDGVTDAEAAVLLGGADLPYADLYDVPESALPALGHRLGRALDGSACYYLVGRESR